MNDVAVTRIGETMGEFTLNVNDVQLTVLRGDGMIISTPTGSTAYNLSCGGSILHPQSKSIIFCPISPHSLSCRPIIFPHDSSVTIQMSPKYQEKLAKVSIDGADKIYFNKDQLIEISQYDHMVPFVRWENENP